MRRSRVAALTLGVGAGACATAAPPSPPPVPAPAVTVEIPQVGWGTLTRLGWPAPTSSVPDEIMRSPMIRDPSFQAEVARWVEHWTERGARWFPQYLERMAWFGSSVDSVLVQAELPPSLRYLPIVESGYSPRAVSRARAVGLWQFMEPTARGLGMSVTPLLDERRDPYKSTRAAAEFLAELRGRFGSWFLALAAYNAGPGRVEGVLRRHAPLAPRSDSLYWALRDRLPRETREFVPKFFAAAQVAANPARYGFEASPEGSGFDFDRVVVPDATTLDVVARAAEADQAEIERLNPEVVRGITPPGRETALRVPRGRGTAFEANYARIPPSDRVTFVEHRVARGETFSHIALRYGVRLSDLRAANPRVRPRYLQIGQRILVPIASRATPGS